MKKLNQKGVTLVEIMVTIAIFSVVFGIISGLFASSIGAQRRTLASQELLSQSSYAVEYMSRQLRMAHYEDQDAVDECTATNSSYVMQPSGLKFLNYQKCCINFYTLNGRLVQQVIPQSSCTELEAGTSYLTSEDFDVEEFNSRLIGKPDYDRQARITIYLRIKGKGVHVEEQPVIEIQNTVSQRNLNIE